jgi:predicted transport protein
MSDIKLFRLTDGKATELKGDASDLEKPLQILIESNLDTLLGIRFLATEYSTGKTHGGRIDSLGIDENNCPVILEYKRSVGENVINQGLFYLDWLMDHQAEFKLLVMEKLGREAADAIDWSAPRLVCIAADFTKYDGHAVQQINRNIELIRYRRFGNDLLLFELANASNTAAPKETASTSGKAVKNAKGSNGASEKAVGPDKSYAEILPTLSPSLTHVLTSLEDYVISLGDDVQRKELRLYVAFKRLKNFSTVVLQRNRLMLYLHLDPGAVVQSLPNARDVSEIGHWGTGDTEVSVTSLKDLEAVKPFIAAAYEGRALIQKRREAEAF